MDAGSVMDRPAGAKKENAMLDQIIEIVRGVGEIVTGARNIASRTHEKTSAADLVTEYDVAVENYLKRELLALLPEAVFYGEEEQENADPTRGWAFVVDPIDGTTNFVRGLRQSAISVALARDGRVELGVVLDPYKEELFSALRAEGYGDLVYETVNANSLSAFVKEQIAENGDTIPDWLNGLVNVFEKTTVGVRKSVR